MRKFLPFFLYIIVSGCSAFQIDTPETMTDSDRKEIHNAVKSERHNCDFGELRNIDNCPDESDFKTSGKCYRATYSSGIAFDVYKLRGKYEVSLPIYGIKSGETIYQVSGCPY